MRGRRVWFAVLARNDGDKPLRQYFRLSLDPAAHGSASYSPTAELFVPARSDGRVILSAWVAPGVQRIAIRGPSVSVADAHRFTLAFRCSPPLQPGIPSKQQALLDEALTLYLDNTIHPPADKAEFKTRARNLATGAELADDVWWTMRVMLLDAGDHHSYIVPQSTRAAYLDFFAPVPPVVTMRGDGLAIVSVSRAMFGGDEQGSRDYAHRLHAAVADVSAHEPRGWILDLRDFGGGDMWPVLAGLSALVNGPLAGEFVSKRGREPWMVGAGRAGTKTTPEAGSIGSRDDTVITAPVAVLIGPGTGSSGEATAVAFKGRPRTRFFGQPTLGWYDSGVVQHYLSDGTMFAVAESLYADRTGHVYDGAIEPDVVVLKDGDPMAAAAAWLSQAAH